MQALRRWPTCAALLGFVAVCSTSVLPDPAAASFERSSAPLSSPGRARCASTARAHARSSRRALTYPGGVTVQARTSGICAASRWPRSSAAIAAGARRSTRASPSGAGVDQSPNSGRADRSTTTSKLGVHAGGLSASRTALMQQRSCVGHPRKGNGERASRPDRRQFAAVELATMRDPGRGPGNALSPRHQGTAQRAAPGSRSPGDPVGGRRGGRLRAPMRSCSCLPRARRRSPRTCAPTSRSSGCSRSAASSPSSKLCARPETSAGSPLRVRQSPRGLGDAVLCAADAVGRSHLPLHAARRPVRRRPAAAPPALGRPRADRDVHPCTHASPRRPDFQVRLRRDR